MRKNVGVGPGRNAFKEVSSFYPDTIREAPLLDERRGLADHLRQVEEIPRGPGCWERIVASRFPVDPPTSAIV